MKPKCLLALLLLAASTAGCSLLPKEEPGPAPKLVVPPAEQQAVYAVRKGPIVEQLKFTGRVAAQQEALLYFRQNGRVREINVTSGQNVAAGTVLAVLETDAANHVALARLDVQAAQVRVDDARQRVGLGNGPSQAQFDLLQIDRERAQLNLKIAEQALADASLVAPFAGKVQDLKLRQGDQVQAFDPSLRLSDLNSLEVRADIGLDVDFQKTALQQKTQLVFGSGGNQRQVTGTVYQRSDRNVDSRPTDPTRQVRIRFDSAPPDGLFLGDLVTVTLVIREKPDALLIPNSALRTFAGRRYVQVLQGNARREVDVETGIEGTTETEILRGLQSGDKVIGK